MEAETRYNLTFKIVKNKTVQMIRAEERLKDRLLYDVKTGKMFRSRNIIILPDGSYVSKRGKKLSLMPKKCAKPKEA